MYQGLTLTQLAEQIQHQNDAKEDLVVDTRQVTLLNGHELSLPDGLGEYEVSKIAHRQIGERLGIPAKFYDRLRAGNSEDPDIDLALTGLLDHNVNTLFRATPERRMFRTFNWQDVQGATGAPRELRAFLSDTYRTRDNQEVAQAVLPILGQIPDVKIMSCDLSDTRMYIKAVAPRVMQAVPKVDHEVQAGVIIRNSEVGHGALAVIPFVYTLWCTNGCATENAKRYYHTGRQIEAEADSYRVYSDETRRLDDRAFFAKLGDEVRAAVDETRFATIVMQLGEATGGTQVAKPVEAMERIAKRFTFSDDERDSILGHLIQGNDLSAYGVLNAVTRASQDAGTYERATELEHVGGQILNIAGTREWDALAVA